MCDHVIQNIYVCPNLLTPVCATPSRHSIPHELLPVCLCSACPEHVCRQCVCVCVCVRRAGADRRITVKKPPLLPQPLSFSRMFPGRPRSLPFPMSPAKQLPPTLLSAQVLMQKSHHTQQRLLQQRGHTCTLPLSLLSHTQTH